MLLKAGVRWRPTLSRQLLARSSQTCTSYVSKRLKFSLAPHAARVPAASTTRQRLSVMVGSRAYSLLAGDVLGARGRLHPRSSCRAMRRHFCAGNEASDAMEYDVVVVGAGPAGLSTAIKLKQLAAERNVELSVCVIEKGAEVGSHILSGNVFETRALDELFPNWKELGAPLETEVTQDQFAILTGDNGSVNIPSWALPSSLNNHGNYIISLGRLCKWLAEQAENMGIEIYPGFAASEVLYNSNKSVKGIKIKDVGIDKNGQPKDTFTPGVELRARQTVFAEGCRGSCSEEIIKEFDLRQGKDMQTYGIGLKEVWEIPEENHKPGFVQHTVGWPLDTQSYGGSFLYHMKPNKVLVGFVLGLDYKNPYLSPYQEFQRWKLHPSIRQHLEGGTCISYGARALNEGGFQAIPKLTFKGGLLVGCSAGFLNVAKIKGSHTAMKSGMIAAEEVFAALYNQSDESVFSGKSVDTFESLEVKGYQKSMENSWVWKELNEVRNVHPSYKWGFYVGLLYSGLTLRVFGGAEPWTFRNKSIGDHATTGKKDHYTPIEYAKPDGKITFDILTNLTRSGVYHEDQPAHLKVKPELVEWPASISYQEYGAPETRFCPAKVYEYTVDEQTGKTELVINAQNCVHCKTCDIKTPGNYIKWTVPEGSGGPQYDSM